MTLRRVLSTTALVSLMGASTAQADLTGADVWADWQAYMRGFGYEMSGTEAQSGDTLTVSDIAMTFDLPEDAGTFSMTMGTLGFVTNSDGSVRVDLPAEMPITFDVTGETGERIQGTLLYQQEAPDMVVTGDPEDQTYTYAAQTVGLVLTDITVDDADLPDDFMKIDITMTDVANVTTTTIGDMRGYTQSMTVSEVRYDVSFDVPEPDAGKGTIQGALTGLDVSGTGSFPVTTEEFAQGDMNALLDAGLTASGAFKTGGGTTSVVAETPDGPFQMTTASQSGAFNMKMDSDGLVYDIANTGVQFDVQVAQFPFPVSVNMAEYGGKLVMPLTADDDPQDFGFGLSLKDFTISDVIWNLFDPAVQLPRDPATLILEISGLSKLSLDLLDPENGDALEAGDGVGEVNALNIDTLQLSAAGAEVTGSGAFTLDNEDLQTFGGMPRPEGSADVRVSGANKLIDTLVTMGLLPEEQAMGARMMMGLFGVPQGDDVLTSKIEVTPEGQVLANGQRIR